ncbi:MAG: thioredoxin domain-containing protein [Cyanobacteria bacterium P01_G01_bin.54]
MLPVTDETFADDVLASPEPILLQFWAPWCKLCRSIEPTLYQFQSQYAHPIRLASVNADNSIKLSNNYRIKTLPTILCFADGRLMGRIEGFPGRDELRRSLEILGEQLLPTLV